MEVSYKPTKIACPARPVPVRKGVLAFSVGLGMAALFLFFGLDAAGRTVPFLHGGHGAVFAAAQPALPPHGVRRLAQEGTNNPPTFLDPINLSVAENTPGGQNVGDPLTATDIDNETLTYSLGGTDAAAFSIEAGTGQLKTRAALDYEAKKTYNVSVTATDPKDASATVQVIISVTDVEEDGRVTLSAMRPRADTALTATLTDPDGGISSVTWRWAKSDTQSGGYADIGSATAASYTPVAADMGKYLRATASYADRRGSGKQASSQAVRVNNPPVFPPGESGARSVAENTPSGENVGDPVTATDTDDSTLAYSLGGTDAASFSIAAATGQLRTRAALDYETKNTYTVTVTATDPAGDSDTTQVTITVTDVEEAGTVTLSSERPRVGTALTATLTDPDGGVSGVTWQWARSDTQTGTYAGIATADSYTPVAADAGKYLRATASYADRRGPGKRASSQAVRVNVAPVFPPGESGARSVAENTPSGQSVGDPVTATDTDDSTLAYSLGGTDAGAFSIVAATGQLRTRAALDYETKNTYTVTVTATDPAGDSDTTQVTITVTDVEEAGTVTLSSERPRVDTALTATLTDPDGGVSGVTWQWARSDTQTGTYAGIATTDSYTPVAADAGKYLRATASYTDRRGSGKQASSVVVQVNNPPVLIPSGSGERSVAENTPSGQGVGDPVTATDADGNTPTHSLGGTDAGSFSIVAATGQLRTRAALDYETKNTYTVNVTATDPVGDSATVTVTIRVTDVEEAGTVTLSAERPRVGTALTASLTDPDGGVSGVTWRWARSDTQTGDYTSIASATAASYTPVAADMGMYLRATASYTDRRGSGKQAFSPSLQVNNPPVFPLGEAGERSVPEDTPAGENVGDPVTASDANDDTLTYSLDGSDAGSFSIVAATGQLRTRAALDYETTNTYTVNVTATDPVGDSATVTVTIRVTDVEEAGTVTLSPELPRVGTALTATLTDPDGGVSGVTWQWARSNTQAGDYTDIASASATAARYTPVAADLDKYLRATASYTDRRGPGKQASSPAVQVNSRPAFPPGESGERSVAENTPSGQNVGDPVTATDANDDTLTYSLGGTDAGSFSIESATGQVKTKAALDYETKNRYSLTVSVSDGKADTTIELTVNVTDVTEPPGQPAPPWLRATSSRELTATWNEPANTGPAISGYDLEYRRDNSGDTYTRESVSASPRSHTIDNLSASTAYEVRVRAKNADGPGEWSNPSSSHTSSASVSQRRNRRSSGGGYIPREADPNQPPVFTEGESARRDTVEGTAGGARVNPPVTATDPDGDPLSYWVTGGVAQLFKMDRHTGQLQTRTGLGYELQPTYTGVAHVSDGRGGSDSIVLNIVVADAQPPVIEVPTPVLARQDRADTAAQSESTTTSTSLPTPTPMPAPAPTHVATATAEPTPTPTKPPEALALAPSGPPPSSQTLAEVPMAAEPGGTGGLFAAIVRWFGLLPSWVFWIPLLLIALLLFLIWALTRRREPVPEIPPPFVGPVRRVGGLTTFVSPPGEKNTSPRGAD